MHPQSDVMNIGWRGAAWTSLLVAASMTFSLGFACATPLAAFAAAAALTMNRRSAMLLVGLVWLANQGIGFVVLHYPWTVDSLAWGVGLGIVALLSTLGAEFGAKQFIAHNRLVASTLAFISAFGVYEGLVFIASMTFASGVADYAPAIIERIFAINAVAFIGLLVVNGLGVSAGFLPEPRRQIAVTGRRS
jgi:hypothetical protein